MTQEVLATFLIQPGVQGIALMDDCSRPYFRCADRPLAAAEREAIAHGIQSILQSVPNHFHLFEFHFCAHKIQLHNLTQHQVFLTFLSPAHLLPTYDSSLDILLPQIRTNFADLLNQLAETQELSILEPASIASDYALKEILTAINQLSQFTTHYLGIIVVVNYWRSSRPKVDWLQQFQIDRKLGITASAIADPITVEQQQWLQDWVAGFTTRCGRVIRNYSTLLKQSGLDDRQRSLLFTQDSTQNPD